MTTESFSFFGNHSDPNMCSDLALPALIFMFLSVRIVLHHTFVQQETTTVTLFFTVCFQARFLL